MFSKNPSFSLNETLPFEKTNQDNHVHNFVLDCSNPFTLCFWIKTTFSKVSPIVAQMDNKEPFVGWDVIINAINSVPGSLRFQLIRSFPDDFIEVETNVSNILDNCWHHIAIIYDGTTNAQKIQFIVDGQKSPSIVISDCLTAHPDIQIPLTIGSRLNHLPEFEGTIHDFRIYNSQLNLIEINQIYNSSNLKPRSKDIKSVEIINLKKTYKIHHNASSTISEKFQKLFTKKHIETKTVLDNITLEIKSGELIGVIGKNGSGKSTLLKIIAGIIEPTAGQISINGSIAPFLSLGSGFNLELDARENIILYGMLLGHTKKSIMSKINTILKFAELETYADVKLKTFSSGMFMRLAFSVAVSLDPDVLLIDEILAVGDESFQQKSFNKLISFRNMSKTIILVTHDLSLVENLCDRVIFINDGHIHSIGNPEEIVNNYKQLIR